MNDPIVLVTGGAGYIGSHACVALAAAGYLPVAFDDLSTGHREAVRWGPLEIGDIADRDRVVEVMRRHAPVAVMHFAASAYVGESVADPQKYYRNNVVGTLNLLEACRACGVNRIIFSSSCATYGLPPSVEVSEETLQVPMSPYGASKLFSERMIADFCSAFGMRAVLLRYFNAAGAHPSERIGESHDPEPHLIPRILLTAAGRADEVQVFGTDYQTVDGSCVRDYVHVCDLADAHVLGLAFLERQAGCTAFNLGNGQGFSVLQVIETARRVTARAVPARLGARRPGDPGALYANAQKARDVLGWRPRYGDLDSILAHAWAWHLDPAF